MTRWMTAVAAALVVLVASPVTATATSDDDSNILIHLPSVIVAGKETTWELSRSKSNKTQGHFEKLEIHLAAAPREFKIDGFIRLDNYCVLAPCIRLNVTSTVLTIPKDAFPEGTSVFADLQYYRSDEDRWGTLAGNGTSFLVAEGDASWSRYESAWGWSPRGVSLPCETVGCARSCMEEHLDPDTSTQSRERRRAYDRCLEDECKFVRPENPAQILGGKCITENSFVPAKEEERPDPGPSGAGSHLVAGPAMWLVLWALLL